MELAGNIADYLFDIILHDEFHRYFSYVFFFIVLYVFRGFFWQDRHEIVKKIKGNNGEYDTLEIAFLLWAILFATCILADLFFDADLSVHGWWSLDTVGLFVLAGKKGPELVAAMKGKSIEHTVHKTEEDGKKETKIETKINEGKNENLDNIGG